MPATCRQLFGCEVNAGSDAGRGKGQLAWICLGESDPVLRRRERRGRTHAQHQLGCDSNDTWMKSWRVSYGSLSLNSMIGHESAVHHPDGIAVGLRVRDRLGADGTPAAAAIVDDQRLTELALHLRRKQAREHVRAASWGVRHDDLTARCG